MNFLKISIGIFLVIISTRLIPHAPNFTSLIALSFYIPAIFGMRYIAIIIFSFAITDLILGFHSLLFFTWGSIIIIGIISKYFFKNITGRILGTLTGAIIFFIITNFAVWASGSIYDFTLIGLINCYVLAIPFFYNTILSTIFYSLIVELINFIFSKKLKFNQ